MYLDVCVKYFDVLKTCVGYARVHLVRRCVEATSVAHGPAKGNLHGGTCAGVK